MHSTPFALSGAGSLPFQTFEEALDFVATYCPSLPYFPELPARSKGEGLVARPLYGSDLFTVLSTGVVSTVAAREQILSSLCHPSLSVQLTNDLALFFSRFSSAQQVKVQFVGPVTFVENIYGVEGLLAADSEIAAALLNFYQEWTALLLAEIPRASNTVFFLDEPMLGVPAKLQPLRAAAQNVLLQTFDQIRAAGLRCGVHCCSALPDSSALWQADALSADLGITSLESVVEKIRDGGSRIALVGLGVISPQAKTFDSARVASDLSRQLRRLPVDVRTFLSPACGLALVDVAQATTVYEHLRTLQQHL